LKEKTNKVKAYMCISFESNDTQEVTNPAKDSRHNL